MKRSTPPRRKTPLRRAGPPKARNAKRAKETFARVYHSMARKRFVASLPCVATGREGGNDNAHIPKAEGAGAGRKGNYDQIVPMRHSAHMLLHRNPTKFAAMYGLIDWQLCAKFTQAMWTVEQARRGQA